MPFDDSVKKIGLNTNGNKKNVKSSGAIEEQASIWSENNPTLKCPPLYPPTKPLKPKPYEQPTVPDSFFDVRMYSENHTAKETYDYLKSGISTNKNDSEKLKKYVDDLLNNLYEDYDHDKHHCKIAGSNSDILQEFINQNKVKGAICSTIHGFVMETLNESGVPAALVEGTHNNRGHITLIYKTQKDNYVWNNYGTSHNIKADNVVSAVKQVFRQDSEFSGKGFVIIQGKGKKYYEEYEYKDEGAFADEIDTSSSNSKSAFSKTAIEKSSSVSQDAVVDGTSKTLNTNINKVSKNQKNQISLDLQYKQSGATELFDNSKSAGIKVSTAHEKNFNKSSLTAETGLLFSAVDGTVKQSESNKEKHTKGKILKENLGLAYNQDIYNSNSTKLSTTVKGSESLAWNMKTSGKSELLKGNFSGDNSTCQTRNVLEGGLKLDYKNDKLLISNAVSFGKVMDIVETDYQTQNWGPTFGTKANINTALTYIPSEKFKLAASMDGFYTKTNVLDHSGITADAKLTYKPNSFNNTEIYSGISGQYDKKRLRIGLFDENINNQKIITIYSGVKTNKNLDIYGSYSQDLASRNKKKTVSVGAKYNFD